MIAQYEKCFLHRIEQNMRSSQIFKLGKIRSFCKSRPDLRDLLHSIVIMRHCWVLTSALQSLSLNGFLYHCFVSGKHIGLENGRGYDVQRSNKTLTCRVENSLQKLFPINQFHRTLSGAKEGKRKFLYAGAFRGIRCNSECCSQYLPNLFCANLLMIEIRKTSKHC